MLRTTQTTACLLASVQQALLAWRLLLQLPAVAHPLLWPLLPPSLSLSLLFFSAR